MRLRDLQSARETLETALSLPGGGRELSLLKAEVLEQGGEIEPAIDELRRFQRRRSENIAATYALVSLLGRLQSEDANFERLTLLTEIITRAPDNLRARCEQARLAATLDSGQRLREALDALLEDASRWPDAAAEQLQQADAAARSDDFLLAARSLTFFENLLKPQAEYQRSLEELGISPNSVSGTPQRALLRLKLPPAGAAEPELDLTFDLQEPPESAAAEPRVSPAAGRGATLDPFVALRSFAAGRRLGRAALSWLDAQREAVKHRLRGPEF